MRRAKQLYAERRKREQAFGEVAACFSEPAWDMLLDLFAAHGEGKEISVSSACIAACVPPTTGLRWVRFMTEAGVIRERDDLSDRRRRILELSPDCLAMMRSYLSAI